jgi:hypothetical protein
VVPDQVANPGREDPGLSGPRSCKDQKGPLEMLHRLPLLRIQAHQVRRP